MERRVDPEPFTVIAAVSGVVSALLSAVSLGRDFFQEAPHMTRRKAIEIAEYIDDLVRYLKTDLQIIEEIFRELQPLEVRGSGSDLARSSAIEISNGTSAHLTRFSVAFAL